MLAQALVAAGRTVDRSGRVHSLHAYFLRPGDPKMPIVFEVDRIRDGRSFTTRRVVAIQHGTAIFNLAASFQVDEAGPDHQMPMPDVPEPETIPSTCVRRTSATSSSRLDRQVAARRGASDTRRSRCAHVGRPAVVGATEAATPDQDVWFRADGTAARRPAAARVRRRVRVRHHRSSTPRRCRTRDRGPRQGA